MSMFALLLQTGEGLAAVDPVPVTGRAVVVSIIVVGLLAVAAWMLRRHLPIARSRHDFAVERALALGERRTLVIVSVENRRLLLGMTPQQVSLITELQAGARPSFDAALEAKMAPGGVA